MVLPGPSLPMRYRTPVLCVLASLALHWIALSALLHTPSEFRVASPVPSLRIAMPARDDHMAGPAASDPVPAVSAPAPPAAESDAARPAQLAPRATGQRPPASAPTAPGSVAAREGTHAPTRARVSPAPPLPSIASAAPARDTRGAPVDDRGIETAEQYRIALLFEAGRLRAGTAHGTGRARVELQFAAGGALQATSVRRSSGDAALDALAIELLQRAHAQLPVPVVLRQRAFTIEASISFEVR